MKAFYLLLFLLFAGGLFASEKQQNIYLFYTNDLRGGIEVQKAYYMNPNFPPVLGGGAAAQGVLKKTRALAGKNGDIVLLLDGGNIFSGAVQIGSASKGKAIIDYMNMAGYDAMVPGNNDFSFGKGNIEALAREAHFPILAANLLDSKTKRTPAPIKPYTIIEKDGIRIGLFGIISKSAEQADDTSNVAGLQFTPEIAAAKKAVAALQKQNVDLIVALTYLGLPYDAQEEYEVIWEEEKQNIAKHSYVTTMEFARFVPGIDVLISGGFNKGYQQPWEDPVNHTLCFQNYASGGNLGIAVLHVNREEKKLSGYTLPSQSGGLLLLSQDEYWPDAEMADSITLMQKKYSPDFDTVIGVTRNTLNRSGRGESPMGDLMCDAMLNAVDADFAFNNFSGMRRDLAIGPITPRDLAGVFPFGNEIVLVTVSGKLLKELMETSVYGSFSGLAVSGGRVVYDSERQDGDKIISFAINGKSVEEDRMYKIATTTYLAEGNSGMSKLAFLPEDRFFNTKVLIRDAVADYIKAHSPLKITVDGRWKKK